MLPGQLCSLPVRLYHYAPVARSRQSEPKEPPGEITVFIRQLSKDFFYAGQIEENLYCIAIYTEIIPGW